ncbi:MAG TPA: hypothetical protein VFI65_11570 [Streptosporangiaceae bacterium]|nr:hypothetical protein [Streptosporangiaceae bacterium]
MTAAARVQRAAALLCVVLATGGMMVASAAGPAQAARAAGAAKCSGKTGINVVVDFTKLKGKVKIGCDRKKPASGLAALTRAGFSYTFVPRQPGFICTIDRKPNKCNGAPTSAYWSYWHAKPHGKWMYSKLGAGSFHPKPGMVEGWAFGKGKPPKISPP